MTLSHFVAVIHLLTFGLGAGACWARAAALGKLKDMSGLKAVFFADNLWGLAAMLWIATGTWRAFGGLEKDSTWYLHNAAFLLKMGLFILVFALEIKPMMTLIRWRISERKGRPIDLSAAKAMSRISWLELALLVPIVVMATAVARGIWY